jgi:hypothetical protein
MLAAMERPGENDFAWHTICGVIPSGDFEVRGKTSEEDV